MPTYLMRNTETGEEKEVIVSIATMEQMKEEGWQQIHNAAPKLVSQHGSTISKTSDGWKDVLKSIKKGSGRDNTINL
jgi:predicted nucleic acid-binding Zn ribbon protein